jgi:hypothetical protein
MALAIDRGLRASSLSGGVTLMRAAEWPPPLVVARGRGLKFHDYFDGDVCLVHMWFLSILWEAAQGCTANGQSFPQRAPPSKTRRPRPCSPPPVALGVPSSTLCCNLRRRANALLVTILPRNLGHGPVEPLDVLSPFDAPTDIADDAVALVMERSPPELRSARQTL